MQHIYSAHIYLSGYLAGAVFVTQAAREFLKSEFYKAHKQSMGINQIP
jgi:hypothetical protein